MGLFLLVVVANSSSLNPSGTPPQFAMWASDYTHHGGYIDELWWRVYPSDGDLQATEAVISGEIDAHTGRVQMQLQMGFPISPADVQVQVILANRYRVLYLNNGKFPLNITGFRRAIAYGMDKHRINDEAIGGAGEPMDSHIPVVMTDWEVESSLSERLYNVDVLAGNTSLEDAGFKDLDGDGWREYDVNRNGIWDSDIDLEDNDPTLVIDMRSSVGSQPDIIAATVAQDGLTMMGIRSTVTETDSVNIHEALMDGSFEIVTVAIDWPRLNPIQVLWDEFHSQSPYNLEFGTRYENAEIDPILQAMVDSKTVDDVKRYAKQAAKLLAYEQPFIVCYNDVITEVWRTDKFDFSLNFATAGRVSSANHYSVTQARLLNGYFGGILKISNMGSMDRANPAMERSQSEANVNNKVFERVLDIDPVNLDVIPRLAYAWEIEAWSEGPVTDGAKYSYYLYPNATWHDGKPVTAYDVNFTLMEVVPKTLAEFAERADIQKVEVPNNHTYVIYVNKSNFFEFLDISFGIGYVVPEHIWRPGAAGNYSAFEPAVRTTWVGSGPFKAVSRVPGEIIKLERNAGWHFAIDWYKTTPTPPTAVIGAIWELLIIALLIITLYVFRKKHRRKDLPLS